VTEATQTTKERKSRRVLIGTVVSAKAQKTAVISIVWQIEHPLYRKRIKRTTRLMVHDENGICKEGDVVQIMECRPISRHKSWRVVKVEKRQE
jgi:small subunit ribosomal protein S17